MGQLKDFQAFAVLEMGFLSNVLFAAEVEVDMELWTDSHTDEAL
jgi:hypothetical protein